MWLEELSRESRLQFPEVLLICWLILVKSSPPVPLDFSLALKIPLFSCQRRTKRLAGFPQVC